MNYQKKLVIIPTDDGTENVTATFVQDTGLGYVQNGPNSYVVIAQNLNNYAVSAACACNSERHAQLFIGELQSLTDWTKDGEVIMSSMASYSFEPGCVDGRIQRAFNDATTKHAKEVAA
jgi:hypothetical protein